jgi:hypothetical protein
MRLWKGFLVVLAVYGVHTIQKTIFTPEPSQLMLLSYFRLIVVTIIPVGVFSWVFYSLIAHLLSNRVFGGRGAIDDILYGTGIAHWPFILSSLSFFFVFLGAAGFFAFAFFSMFFALLAYFFFVEAIVAFYGFSWKKATALFIVTMIIFTVIMFLSSMALKMSVFPETMLPSQLYDPVNTYAI